MDEAEGSNYWCHMCSQTVNLILEAESFKCSICRGGFVEEMASATAGNAAAIPGRNGDEPFEFGASDSDPQNVPIGSSGDHFVGRSLDLLLQHLAESDTSRYGTPPARKDVVEALPQRKLRGRLCCSAQSVWKNLRMGVKQRRCLVTISSIVVVSCHG